MFDRKKRRVLVIHGPNLNLLGEREPEHYGRLTLRELNREIKAYAKKRNIKAHCYQSNHEGKLIDRIHKLRRRVHGIVINPGGLTHTSVSLRDAISAVRLPAVEVHLSDIHSREDFRKSSFIEPVCVKQISGKGKDSYLEGIDALVEHWKKS